MRGDGARDHRYEVAVEWTGAHLGPTKTYAGYSRDHTIAIAGKSALAASADPLFRGSAERHNPEELLVAALASCHMLAYLALCAREGIAIVAYRDAAEGTMSERAGVGRFTAVTLFPHVTIDDDRIDRASELHENAHAECFIANSVNFPVLCSPVVVRAHCEAVVNSLRERLERLENRPKRRLVDEFKSIADRLATLPILDARPSDEILGYDEHGLP